MCDRLAAKINPHVPSGSSLRTGLSLTFVSFLFEVYPDQPFFCSSILSCLPPASPLKFVETSLLFHNSFPGNVPSFVDIKQPRPPNHFLGLCPITRQKHKSHLLCTMSACASQFYVGRRLRAQHGQEQVSEEGGRQKEREKEK